MSRVLTLELPDEVYQPMAEAAADAGLKLEDWAVARLKACAPTASERAAALARLMTHAGAVDLGRLTGADNSGIDADTAV
jgi:hypothetical protein